MTEETSNTEVKAKKVTEVAEVTMTDGRVVSFPGKRKVQKDVIIDENQVVLKDSSIKILEGAVSIRMDFRNGDTRTYSPPLSLLLQFAGHGIAQKYGDELASPADKPLSEADMVIAVDDLDATIQSGKWGKGRASGGGSVSGASVVIQAICEATGKDLTTVKAYLQKKIDSDPDLTRKALYDSFRVAGTKTGEIIARIEAAALAKNARVNADEELTLI